MLTSFIMCYVVGWCIFLVCFFRFITRAKNTVNLVVVKEDYCGCNDNVVVVVQQHTHSTQQSDLTLLLSLPFWLFSHFCIIIDPDTNITSTESVAGSFALGVK